MASVKQEFQLIETRLISGRGLFKLNYNGAYRAFRLFSQIVRQPTTNYNNYKWNPPRSEYAKVTWNTDNFVIREDVIKYQSQRLDWVVDGSGDAPFYSLCENQIVTDYFDYLAPFVGAPPLTRSPDLIYYIPLSYYFDNILVSCRDDTAIAFDLWGLKYNINCDRASQAISPRPTSPAKIATLPPGTPIGNVSPPYDPITNDDGNTIPFGGDGNPVEPCVSIVRGAGLNSTDCTALNNRGDYTFTGYAELRPVTVPPNNCSGLRLFLDGIDQGVGQTYYTDAIVISRTGNCIAPPPPP